MNKTEITTFRATKAQVALIKKAAKSLGMSVSSYIVAKLTGVI